MHLEYSKVQFQTDAVIDAKGTTLYDYLGDLVRMPVFAQVQGRGPAGTPELGYVPLVREPRVGGAT